MAKKSITTSPRRGITAPQGFRAAGIHCGIKKPGLLDLALVVSEQSGPIAGVFTQNQVVAAPVIVDRLHLRQGIGRAILVNSGNANACTGAKGLAAAKKSAAVVARHMRIPSQHVFIGSTGVIGRALPVNRIVKGIPKLLAQLSDRGGPDAARAIMTTDLRPKSIALQDTIGGRLITIGGMAKGSGMIHPNMATMLAYFTTDASITKSALQRALSLAANESFNCISVDGDTSTNDTVLCLANGMAENRTIKEGTPAFQSIPAAPDRSLPGTRAGHLPRRGRRHQGGEHRGDWSSHRGAGTAGRPNHCDIELGEDRPLRRGCQLGSCDGGDRTSRGSDYSFEAESIVRRGSDGKKRNGPRTRC